VDRVLRALRPQPAVLTVLGSGVEAAIYLTFGQAPLTGLDVAGLGRAVPAEAAWRAALEAEDDGPGCLEVRWRAVVPA
jgi:hypothetical protein